MATSDLPETPDTRISPQLMVGAASPLWAYFAAATAGGLAYWWLTQWARPVNLEAMFGKGSPMMPFAAPVEAAAEAMVDAVEAAQEALAEAAPEVSAPVGGESAPISPILALAPLPESEPEAPVAEDAIEAAAEPVIEATKEAEAAIEAAPEAVVEAAPEPVIEEPAPPPAEQALKLRGKKSGPPAVGDA